MPGTRYDVDIAIAVSNLQTLDQLNGKLQQLKTVQGVPPGTRSNLDALAASLDRLNSRLNTLTGADRQAEDAGNRLGRATSEVEQSATALRGAMTGLGHLAAALARDLELVATASARAGTAGRQLAADSTREQDAALRLAASYARLHISEGQLAEAVQVLRTALRSATQESVTANSAQKLLIDTEAKLTNETSKADNALLLQARTLARLAQVAGDPARAIQILQQALSQVNPGTLAAIRTQLQLTYLNTNYANSPLISSIRSTQAGFAQLLPLLGRTGGQLAQVAFAGQQGANALSGMVSAGAGLGSVVTLVAGLVVTVISLAAAVKLVEAGIGQLVDIAKEGIEVGNQLTRTTIAIASVIQASGEIKIGGQAVDSAHQFEAALSLANVQVQALKTEAAALGLSFADVVDGYRLGLAPLTRQKVSLEDSRKIILGIVAATKSQGLPLNQVGQELRAILNGEQRRSDLINQILQISKEDIKVARERGEVAKLLLDKLQPFIAGGNAFAQTFEGGIARADAAFKVLEADVTSGLRKALNDAIQDGLKLLGKESIADTFTGITQTLTQIFDGVGARGEEVIRGILELIVQIDTFLDQNREQVGGIVEIVFQMVDLVGLLLKTFFQLIGNSDDLSSSLSTVKLVMTVIYGVLLLMVTSLRLFSAGVVGVGAAIATGLLVPLAGFAQALASFLKFIPGIGDAAQGAADAVTNAAAVAQAATQRAGRAMVSAVGDIAGQTERFIKGVNDAEERARGRKRQVEPGKIAPPADNTEFTGHELQQKEKEKKAAKDAADTRLRAEEELQKAILSLREAFGQRAIALAKADLELENRILDQQLEDRKISLTDFYKEKINVQQRATALEIGGIQEAIRAERDKVRVSEEGEKKRLNQIAKLGFSDAALARKDVEELEALAARRVAGQAKLSNQVGTIKAQELKARADIQTKIVKLETDLEEAERKGQAAEADIIRKRIAAFRDMEQQAQQLQSKLLELQGQTLSANLLDIRNKYKELEQIFVQAFKRGSVEVSNLIKARALELGNALLAELQRVTQNIGSELDVKRTGINVQVQSGLLSEIEARKETLRLEVEKKEELLRQLAIEEQIVRLLLAPGPTRDQALLNIQRKRLEAEQLGVDPLFAEIRRGFEQDLSGAFSQFLRSSTFGLKELSNLALGIANSFRNAFAKVIERFLDERVIRPISDKFFKSLFPDQAKKDDLLKNPQLAANTGAISSNTLALQNLVTALQGLGLIPGGAGFNFPINFPGAGLGDKNGEFAPDFINLPKDASLGKADAAVDKHLKGITSHLTTFAFGLSAIGAGIGGTTGQILSAIGAVLGILSSFGAFGAKVPGRADGGYAGQGDPAAVAGVYHHEEMIFSARETRYWGVPYLNTLRAVARGYGGRGMASGGFGGGAVPAQSAAGALAGNLRVDSVPSVNHIRIVNVDSEEKALSALDSPRGEKIIVNTMVKNQSQIGGNRR